MSDERVGTIPAAALQAANAAFAEAAADLRAALQERQGEAARLAAELDRVKAELEAQQATAAVAAAAAQGQGRSLEHGMGELREQLARSASALAEANERREEQCAALDAAAREAARLHAELAALRAGRDEDAAAHARAATALQVEVSALQEELLAGTRRRSALEQELARLRAESQQRLLQLQEADTLRQGHERQLAELTGAVLSLRAAEARLRQSAQRQQTALAAASAAAAAEREAHAAHAGRLEAEVNTLREQAEHQAATHRYEVEQLRVRLNAAAAQIDNLQTDNNDLREAHAAELQAERARAAHVATEAAQLGDARRREWTQLRGGWERAVAERESLLRATQAQLRGAEEHARWLGWTTERLQTRIEEGQARERRLLQQWQQLRTEAHTLRGQLEAAAAERAPSLEHPPTPATHAAAPTDAPEEAPAMNDTLPDIQHVNQLLALRDARFVRAAYLSILGREPDAEGLAHHLARVRSDHDKVAVVNHLATSAEGLARPHQLAGLQELLAEQRPRDGRIARWLQRVAMGFSGVRRVEASLDAAAEDLSGRLDALEGRLEQLAAQLAQTAEATRQDTARLRELLERQTAGLGTSVAGCQASVAACEQQLAALPALFDARFEALMQAQHRALREALDEARHKPPAPEPPPAPSAKGLQLDAAQGATAFLGQLASALASTQEAALLAGTARP